MGCGTPLAFRVQADGLDDEVKYTGTIENACYAMRPRRAGRAEFCRRVKAGIQPAYRDPHEEHGAWRSFRPQQIDQLAQAKS